MAGSERVPVKYRLCSTSLRLGTHPIPLLRFEELLQLIQRLERQLVDLPTNRRLRIHQVLLNLRKRFRATLSEEVKKLWALNIPPQRLLRHTHYLTTLSNRMPRHEKVKQLLRLYNHLGVKRVHDRRRPAVEEIRVDSNPPTNQHRFPTRNIPRYGSRAHPDVIIGQHGEDGNA